MAMEGGGRGLHAPTQLGIEFLAGGGPHTPNSELELGQNQNVVRERALFHPPSVLFMCVFS